MLDDVIRVVSHDPAWATRFASERSELERALRPWLSAGVEHVGSTAVPRLPAKPILDMVAGVRDLEEARAAHVPLRQLGYVPGVHRPDEALYFFKPAVDHWNERTHQLHLTEVTSSLWRERLAFRDALRADPALVREYAELKGRLAAEHGNDLTTYTARKRDFVRRVLATAGVQPADLKSLSDPWCEKP